MVRQLGCKDLEWVGKSFVFLVSAEPVDGLVGGEVEPRISRQGKAGISNYGEGR